MPLSPVSLARRLLTEGPALLDLPPADARLQAAGLMGAVLASIVPKMPSQLIAEPLDGAALAAFFAAGRFSAEGRDLAQLDESIRTLALAFNFVAQPGVSDVARGDILFRGLLAFLPAYVAFLQHDPAIAARAKEALLLAGFAPDLMQRALAPFLIVRHAPEDAAAVSQGALADPDAQPSTPAQLARMQPASALARLGAARAARQALVHGGVSPERAGILHLPQD